MKIKNFSSMMNLPSIVGKLPRIAFSEINIQLKVSWFTQGNSLNVVYVKTLFPSKTTKVDGKILGASKSLKLHDHNLRIGSVIRKRK